MRYVLLMDVSLTKWMLAFIGLESFLDTFSSVVNI